MDKKQNYKTLKIEIIEFKCEKGFAQTSGGSGEDFEDGDGGAFNSNFENIGGARSFVVAITNYLLFLTSIITLSCCSNYGNLEVEDGEDGDATAVELTINASQGSQGRDGSVDMKSSLNGLIFTWINNDMLSVYNSVTNSAKFTIDGDGGSNREKFSGNINYPIHDEKLCAIYPYDENIKFTEAGKYLFNLPATQIQTHSSDKTIDTTSIGNYIYMYGKTASAIVEGGGVNLHMKHIMSILDFNVVEIPANTKIYSLTMRADCPTFVNSVAVDFSGAEPTIISGENRVNKMVVEINGMEGIIVDLATLKMRLVVAPQTIEVAANSSRRWIVELATSAAEQESATNFRRYTVNLSRDKVYKSGKRYGVNLSYVTDFVDDTPAIPTTLVSPILMDYAKFGGQLTNEFNYFEKNDVSLAPSSEDINVGYGANSNYPWLTGVELIANSSDSRKGIVKLAYIPHNQSQKADYLLTINVGDETKTIVVKYDNGYIPNSVLESGEFAMVTNANGMSSPAAINRNGWATRGFHFAKRGYVDDEVHGINPFVEELDRVVTVENDAVAKWQSAEVSAQMSGDGAVDNLVLVKSMKYNSGSAQTRHLIDRDEVRGDDLIAYNHPSAVYCGGMGDGWYIPSISELKWIYSFATPYLGSSYEISKAIYWSATEHSNLRFARFVSFATGSLGGYSKTNQTVSMRCIKNL